MCVCVCVDWGVVQDSEGETWVCWVVVEEGCMLYKLMVVRH